MRSPIVCIAFVASLLPLVACGGSSAGVVDGPSSSSGGASSSSSGGGASSSSGGSSSGEPDPGGPRVRVIMSGTTASFTHADGFAGETPTREIVAVKSLRLYRSPGDAQPVKIFDHGASTVEVELVSAKPTLVAERAVKNLPAGVFTMAKVGVAYVRYSVAATMHGPPVVPGGYDNVQALSDGAVIDGVSRKKGYFKYTFVVGGTPAGTREGENAPTPVATATGGIGMDMSGPETFYVFPVQVAIDPNVAVDQVAKFVVNVFESFRWQDQSMPGYATKVFDTTPSGFEPIMAFGANTFALTITPKQ